MTTAATTLLRSSSGLCVTAELDYTVTCNRAAAGPWEAWTAERLEAPGTVAFRSHAGYYLTAELESPADGIPRGLLTAGPRPPDGRVELGPWQTFTYEVQPSGLVALRSWQGLYVAADPLGVIRADRDYPAPGEYEYFEASPPWWAIAAPLEGALTASYDGGVCDARGVVLPILCHAGDLLSRARTDPARVAALLDQIAAAGYAGVRTWTVLYGEYWQNATGEITPDAGDYWTTVGWFVTALETRGLRWLVSQGDLMRWAPTAEGRRAYMRDLATLLRDRGGLDRVFGVDAANEGGGNGEGDPAALADALDAFVAVLDVPIRTLTSVQREEEANVYAWPGCLRDIHSSRAAWPTPARRVFNIGYETEPHEFTMQSEGPGEGCQEYPGDTRVGHHVSVTDVPDEWNSKDPEIVGVQAACHAIGKAQFVYFNSPGVQSDEDFTNYPAFTAAPALYRRLPADVQTWTPFHGGADRWFSPDRIVSVPPDDGLDVRCDHAMPDGPERIAVVYGPPGDYALEVINDFRGVVIDPGTLEETAVEWAAGDTIRLAFNRGRILLGEIPMGLAAASAHVATSLEPALAVGARRTPAERRLDRNALWTLRLAARRVLAVAGIVDRIRR